jgi:putative redox protein
MVEEAERQACEGCAFDRSVSGEHLGGYQVVLRTREHSWLVDEPPGVGGDGLAPNPFDMLLASLCSCTIITIRHFATRDNMAVEKMWADSQIDREGSGRDGKYHVRLVIKVSGRIAPDDLGRIREYAGRCPVHGLLSKGAEIETEVVLL